MIRHAVLTGDAPDVRRHRAVGAQTAAVGASCCARPRRRAAVVLRAQRLGRRRPAGGMVGDHPHARARPGRFAAGTSSTRSPPRSASATTPTPSRRSPGRCSGARWGMSAVPAPWRRVLHGWPGLPRPRPRAPRLLTARGGAAGPAGRARPHRLHPAGPGYGARRPPVRPEVLPVRRDRARRGPRRRRRRRQPVPAGAHRCPARLRGEHINFRLMDRRQPDNPNLDFVLDDAARPSPTARRGQDRAAALRRRPLAHAHGRRPLRRPPRISAGRALQEVCAALPDANPNPHLVAALRRLATSIPASTTPLMEKDGEHER